MDFDGFIADDKTTSAVVLKLEIIGEATKNIPEAIRRKYPKVPWQQMVETRDSLIHEYFSVNYYTVWDTSKNRIPLTSTYH